MSHKKISEAIDQYERALKLGAPAAITHFEMAQAYLNMEDTKNARAHLGIFLAAKGNEPNQWWLRAGARAQVASIDHAGSRVDLFENLPTEDALAHRESFSALALSWIDKTWNKDFLGHRSTEDFLLYVLTETGIIPKIPDRESAIAALHGMLGELVVAESGTSPLLCRPDVGYGQLIIVEKMTHAAPTTIYVSVGPGTIPRYSPASAR